MAHHHLQKSDFFYLRLSEDVCAFKIDARTVANAYYRKIFN